MLRYYITILCFNGFKHVWIMKRHELIGRSYQNGVISLSPAIIAYPVQNVPTVLPIPALGQGMFERPPTALNRKRHQICQKSANYTVLNKPNKPTPKLLKKKNFCLGSEKVVLQYLVPFKFRSDIQVIRV